jgi:hypothetical protein
MDIEPLLAVGQGLSSQLTPTERAKRHPRGRALADGRFLTMRERALTKY